MPAPHSSRILALACVASFLVVLDAMIVSVALPAMRRDLGLDEVSASWVVNAYTLTFAGFLLLGGRCVDVFGRWRVLRAGAALFSLACVGCGLATDAAVLFACRGLQGLGAAMMIPATLAVLTATFTDASARTHALSSWSAVAGLGAAAGPLVGGVLTSALGWRWVFFVNVPFGVLVAAAAIVLAEPRVPSDRRPRLDVVGAVLATAGLLGVVIAIMIGSTAGWAAPDVLGVAGAGLALLALFVAHQRWWAREPLLPLGLFALRTVSGANSVMFLLGLGFVSSLLVMSSVMQDAWSASPLAAGLGFVPLGVAMVVGARAAGYLTHRVGVRATTVWCCAVAGAGLVWAALGVRAGSPYVLSIGLPGAVFGLGAAAAFTPLTVGATSGVDPARHGVAAGLLNTMRQASGAVGVALLGAVAIGTTPGRGHLADGYGNALGVAACLLLAAAALALLVLPRRPRTSVPG